MRYRIEHEVPGRIRVCLDGAVPERDVDALSQTVLGCTAIHKVTIFPRIGSLAVCYSDTNCRPEVLRHLARIDEDMMVATRAECSVALAPRTHSLLLDIADLVGGFYLSKWFLPSILRTIWTLWHYRRYLWEALRSLARPRLDVPVLDASAIGVSLVQADPATAAETMFLLDFEETLEDYTRARSQNELIYSLLTVPESAQLVRHGQEEAVPARDLAEGDLIVLRTGMPVPIDGTVERGVAMVNQAALTGEPLAVERTVGDDVFAGTAVEEGEVFVRVRATTGKTKLRAIVTMVEQSSALRSYRQERRDRLADAIVPWNFLLAALVGVATRDITKVAASLMVDYSCALKLTGSISVLAAMSESARLGFTVKGSKHFERVAAADTIVFDKTGTITEATPQVAKVMGFNGWSRTRVLRLAACLEEHYPHPVARAVVNAASEANLKHRERHADVEYIVAHGLASSVGGVRVVIGSRHFVVEDEHVEVLPEVRQRIMDEMGGLSVLYLAYDGQLVGALGIEDPLKPGAAEAVADLQRLGFRHVIMLTGDNLAAARRVAHAAGITEFQANMLPEDKHAFVERLQREGRHVVMVGDGVNDSPALSAADVGVAMAAGTAIAREVADITLTDSDLQSLVRLRRISQGLDRRFDQSFRTIMGFNSLLLALGIAGVITPQTSSLLHNGSTVLLGTAATRSYL
ncbi:MAG: heavy metal translocating P-type ATPase [Atopobiaceae bacterium]|nr:heavy metal translocating P-type ATPase [Atopobiaceae bacterium]